MYWCLKYLKAVKIRIRLQVEVLQTYYIANYYLAKKFNVGGQKILFLQLKQLKYGMYFNY